ncbi:class II aldolase/adducin family protein [Hoeflea ulvae]|uniref:Class II aldolase/adducin family protein n=1 Tax=Hoeflea ulvae TaxID=2983764 RepID=A0ABT3YC67_9HYPH|nr:class II aldolase/adducin family protein [Hoeflea ulvae]MCY0093471.1 class II aldolase/adducin family protein [Hoeflea ulvae]
MTVSLTQNRWSDAEAARWQQDAGEDPADRDLALRIYTSRLIGGDPDLVLHGGGNTSVKTVRGADDEVMHVKGSGWDLETIEAPGLPALHLEAIRTGGRAQVLSDPQMVALLRENLLDPKAPNPSLETLLHAFLPAKFVDHSHATAVLVLVNQPDADAICRTIYGDRLAVVPYVMPGYDLSIAAAEIAEVNPGCEGLWLVNHGIFTFGETARQSYDRMIEFVNMAERHLASRGVTILPTDEHPQQAPFIELLKQRLQAAGPVFADKIALDARAGPSISAFLAHPDLADLATRGTVTPDHVIRVKPFPLLLKGTESATQIDQALTDYGTRYEAYFHAGAAEAKEPKVMLDCLPRVAQIENTGMVGIGKTAAEAKIVADLTSQSMRVMLAAEAYGRFTPLKPGQLFEMEYWSLEQAKLAK